MNKILSIVGLLVLITISCIAQNNQANTSALIDTALNEKQNQFLNNQAEALLNQASEVFSDYPPNWPEPVDRRTLMLLDGVLHDEYAPHRPPVQLFFKTHMRFGKINPFIRLSHILKDSPIAYKHFPYKVENRY
ncbi:MAG: hypothetical protein GXO89_02160 [Chlorobi bacterium]|nr:hypothetical protein [Chlorobiota bacterium]